jgi:hypothetical protein
MDAAALVKAGTFFRRKNCFEHDDRISFVSPGYQTTPFSLEQFHGITPQHSRKRVAFIDGGDLCIMGQPHQSLHLIRTYGHIVQSRKTISSAATEFYLSVRASHEGETIGYVTESMPIKSMAPPQMRFDSMDSRLKEGVDRGSIQKVAGIVRKVAELNLARDLLAQLEEGDIIMLDGTLEARFEAEQEALEQLFIEAQKRCVLVTALAKSTNLLSSEGYSVTELIQNEAPQGTWFYGPCAEAMLSGHQASIFFVKLHKKATFAFRFELYAKQTKLTDHARLFSFLSSLSNDLSLPGYPYGMIRADKFARVSMREREYLQHVLMGALPGLKDKSVHDILDSIG